ncbi:zinc finger BED domain-containing protein 4-like [Melanaphis sacchari]|uniref:zinc finger BED domain-containing protein 4-like n=1 Tax=Melanaphis sacchari TaxID=742174 RepID=UPI000DC13A7D|nr:zinc finger BED domain-containing protein 4-like [Melanaphis sacchari]
MFLRSTRPKNYWKYEINFLRSIFFYCDGLLSVLEVGSRPEYLPNVIMAEKRLVCVFTFFLNELLIALIPGCLRIEPYHRCSNIPVETNSIQDLNQIELDKYLSLPSVSLHCNPLKWWKLFHSEFPTLAKLATKYLCIQGTSVLSERIFSCAGNVITDHRSSLSPEHAEELIFLSMNAKYVSK